MHVNLVILFYNLMILVLFSSADIGSNHNIYLHSLMALNSVFFVFHTPQTLFSCDCLSLHGAPHVGKIGPFAHISVVSAQ